jgi:hypothetical protein
MESRFTPSPAESEGPRGEDAAGRGPTELADVVANVGERVQEILDAAERIAADIRAEAEAAADRHLRERRQEAERAVEQGVREFTNLTQSLSVRVETLQREASALVEALEQARRSLVGFAQGVEQRPDAPTPEPPTDTPPPERIPEQATLRATQMAVAGVERTEIEVMLRTEFGVEDPAAVIDRMLGPERA